MMEMNYIQPVQPGKNSAPETPRLPNSHLHERHQTPENEHRDGHGHGLEEDIDEEKYYEEADEAGEGHHRWPKTMPYFIAFMISWEALMIVLFIMWAVYEGGSQPGANTGNRVLTSFYAMMTDVHVMIFVGFAYLMTFLRRYGYGAIGYTYLVATVCIQWYLLTSQFWKGVMTGVWDFVEISIFTVGLADFCVAAVLISFGSVIGKITPLQLVLMGIIEVTIYALNESIGKYKFIITDVGNSITLHLFGAYFGLVASLWLTPNIKEAKKNPDCQPLYRSDMFASFGTYWLWMFWPSFNALFAVTGEAQARAVVNTFFSITASTIVTFGCSMLLRKKFDSIDIQNATLAGGVAIGSAADLYVGAGASIGVGCLAGIVAVVGEVYIQRFLQRRLNFHDVCGVHNLHGMPGLIGAAVNFIVVACATPKIYKSETALLFPAFAYRTAKQQSYWQFVYAGTTIALAASFGAITGICLSREMFVGKLFYNDKYMWHCTMEEIPNYHDTSKLELDEFDERLKMVEEQARRYVAAQQASQAYVSPMPSSVLVSPNQVVIAPF